MERVGLRMIKNVIYLRAPFLFSNCWNLRIKNNMYLCEKIFSVINSLNRL
jgi:hypothetical protein